MDIKQIKEYYRNFEDEKIEYIAKTQAALLRTEVLSILTEEINKRGLDPNLIKAITVQTRALSPAEIQKIKHKIQSLPCPECHDKKSALVGAWIRKVISVIIFTNYEEKPYISCQTCARKKRKKALISTLLFGWWGIPQGFYYTLKSLFATWSERNKYQEISDKVLTSFIVRNVGEIETHWEDEEKLIDLISHENESLN